MSNLVQYVDVYDRPNRNEDHSLKQEDRFQPVYASQSYGTFFSVYAKFNLDIGQSDIPGRSYFVESVDFKVANYKGILDIGIQNVISPQELMEEVNANPQVQENTVKAFILEMRAMGGLDGPGSSQPTYDFPLPLGMEIKADDLLFFQRVKLHLHSNANPLERGIFDDEFFYREGPGRATIVPRSAQTDHIRPDLSEVQFDFMSGYRCPTSENLVI